MVLKVTLGLIVLYVAVLVAMSLLMPGDQRELVDWGLRGSGAIIIVGVGFKVLGLVLGNPSKKDKPRGGGPRF